MDPKGGGPSVSCPSLACAQVATCKDVAILTYDLDRQSFYELELPYQDRLSIHSIRGGSFEKILGWRAKSEVRRLIKDYDVLHIHGVWSQLAAEACVAARRADIPYVIAPRGMLDPWSLKQKGIKKKIALALRWRKILSHAHFIHALNEDEAELMSWLGLNTTIRISPNGIFREKLRALESVGSDEYRKKYGEYILFMSRLHYKKGLDYLIDGYSEYLKLGGMARLVIAGPDEGERDNVIARISNSGLKDKVDLIGPVYGQAKYSLLKGARAFCLPSRQEGFSMAIIEASAMGIPVIISNNCHFKQVSAVGGGDVVDLDAKSIARSLIKYADNDTDAGERGSELIKSEYVWEAIAPKLCSWYS
jgi:glycosyltransferase involved in cell wall biosynthesis